MNPNGIMVKSNSLYRGQGLFKEETLPRYVLELKVEIYQ